MAVKSFLQVPGIPGDSKDPSHPGWSDVLYFSKPTLHQGRGSGGRPPEDPEQPKEIQVAKVFDGASAPLLQAATDARPFPQVTIESIGDKSVQTLTLTDVLVSNMQLGGSQGGKPGTDLVMFSYIQESINTTPRKPGARPQTVMPNATASSDEEAPDSGTGPIGSGDYLVKKDDCVSSIAKSSGHFWETIWNEPGNSEVKEIRKDPNVLLEGDRLVVPDLRRKDETGATELRHRFRRKGEPAKFRLRLLAEPDEDRQESDAPAVRYENEGWDVISEDSQPVVAGLEDRPRANVPFVLDIDGSRTDGATDEDGRLELSIPGNARRGKLILNPGEKDQEEFVLNLGHLSPVSEPLGVKQRLANLTFECGDRSDDVTDGLKQAIRAFQEKNTMEVTGDLSEEFRTRLLEMHGS